MKQVFLYGSSGHAKVIIDIIEGAGLFRIVGLIDDDPALAGVSLMGYPILGPGSRLSELVSFDMDVIVSIGHNATRRAIAERLTAVGYRLATAVHVRATVSRDVEIGPGSVVMAGAIINAGSRLGPLTILNTGAQIDHDCHIGTACHMAPVSCLCEALSGSATKRSLERGPWSSRIAQLAIGSWSGPAQPWSTIFPLT